MAPPKYTPVVQEAPKADVIGAVVLILLAAVVGLVIVSDIPALVVAFRRFRDVIANRWRHTPYNGETWRSTTDKCVNCLCVNFVFKYPYMLMGIPLNVMALVGCISNYFWITRTILLLQITCFLAERSLISQTQIIFLTCTANKYLANYVVLDSFLHDCKLAKWLTSRKSEYESFNERTWWLNGMRQQPQPI